MNNSIVSPLSISWCQGQAVLSPIFVAFFYYYLFIYIFPPHCVVSVAPVADSNLIRPYRKCAFHLPYFCRLHQCSLSPTRPCSLETHRGLKQHFTTVKLFPLFCTNIIVSLTSCIHQLRTVN